MMPFKLLPRFLNLALTAFFLVSCATPVPASPTATPTTEPAKPLLIMPQPTESVPAGAPVYGSPGPYPVGMAYTIISKDDIKVETYIFLPIGPDGAPDKAKGPYPLVVFSKPLGDLADITSLLTHLASYGFVVIAPTPRGENGVKDFWAGAATRIQDTKLILDTAEKWNAASGQLAGLIDLEHTAMGGYSRGTGSALVGGGARWDFGWCAVNADMSAKMALSNCPQYVPHQDEIAVMLGLPEAPKGLWPQMSDPRIKAVFIMAPDGEIWGAEYDGVESMMLPVMVMTGSEDEYNFPDVCAYPIYAHLGSAKKSLVVIENEGHMVFSVDPLKLDKLALAEHFATAFLLSELKGDVDAVRALLPENASIPGVKYETAP